MAYTKAELQKTITEKLVPALQEKLREKTGFAAATRNRSDLAVKGVDTIRFPYDTLASIEEIAVDGSLTLDKVTYKSDTLTLDGVLGRAFALKRHLNIESVLNLAVEEMANTVGSMKVQRDKKIYDELVSAFDATNKIVRSGDSRTDVIALRKKLFDNKVPFDGNVYLAVNSTDMAAILDTPGFVEADKLGSDQAVREGVIGKIFGMLVLEHNYDETIAFHRNAVNWADQGEMIVMSQENATAISDDFSISMKFGQQAAKTEGSDICPYVAYLADV